MNHFAAIKTPKSVLNSAEKMRNSAGNVGFNIKCDTTEDGIEIMLYGVVGDSYDGADALTITKTLQANSSAPVTMRINSGGGSAFDGIAIHNAMRDHKGPTTAIVESLAASAASLAAMGAEKIMMQNNAVFHVHQSLTFGFGHQADIADTLSWLQAVDESLALTYSERTGIPVADMRAILLGEHGDGTKYSAAEAMKAGFVDAVIGEKKPVKKTKNESSGVSAGRMRFIVARQNLAKMR